MNNDKKQKAEESINIQQLTEYVTSEAVGFPVVVAIGTGQERETEYQIMPADEIRSGVEEFWNWHAENNENWFETSIEAAANFVLKYKEFYATRQKRFIQINNRQIDLNELASIGLPEKFHDLYEENSEVEFIFKSGAIVREKVDPNDCQQIESQFLKWSEKRR